jgi:hypothetical protein
MLDFDVKEIEIISHQQTITAEIAAEIDHLRNRADE